MSIGSFRQESIFQTARIANFCVVGNGQALSVSTTTNPTELLALAPNSPATDIMIVNDGSASAFIAFGTSAPTAAIPTNGSPANGICIRAGSTLILDRSNFTYIDAITAVGTTTIYLYQGFGS